MTYALLALLFVVAALVDGSTWSAAVRGVAVWRLWPNGPGAGFIDTRRAEHFSPRPSPGYLDLRVGWLVVRFAPEVRYPPHIRADLAQLRLGPRRRS